VAPDTSPDTTTGRVYVPPPPPLARRLEPLKRGLFAENPLLVQVLGVCSALAVTSRLDTTLVMCTSLLFVATLSSFMISLLRNYTPRRARMIAYMLVIATFVILVDQYLKAYHFKLSQALGPYVGLIITNCIVMGRCEVFASRNPPLASVFDGLSNAAGYGLVLLCIALVREPLGAGTILGMRVMPESYDPCQLMSLAPGAFFTMGVLVWIVRSKYPPEQTGPKG